MIKKWKLAGSLIRQGGWMFFAIGLGSFFNLLYQLFMVRNLTPADYGILNSLLALLLMGSVPTATLQTAITKFVSAFHAYNHWRKIRFFLSRLAKMVFIFGLTFALMVILGSKGISSFLQIPSSAPVIIIGMLLFFSVILPLALGGLQGLQMFGWFGLNMIIGGGLKLIIGITLVSLGFRVMGALGGCVLTSLSLIFLSFVPLRRFILEKSELPVSPVEAADSGDYPDEIDFSKVYKYFFPVAITLLCFMSLVNADIILVKHFFSPLEAGYYSIAQMAGKIILFLPGAITVVMFPKVSHLHALGKDTLPILKKSLFLAGLLCGGAALVCILFPSLIIKLLSGKEYAECLPLIWLFAVAMAFFALLYTLLFYQLSIHSLDFIYPLIFFAVLQIVLIVFFHRSLSQVLYILCGNSILLFVLNLRLISSSKSLRE